MYREFSISDSELLTEMKRVRKSVYKPDKHSLGFQDSNNLANWWADQMKRQEGCCDYCKTPIKREILESCGWLKKIA